jgi:hypothetical protein
MAHEGCRADERRQARSADHAGLEVEERRAGHLLAARRPLVKNVHASGYRTGPLAYAQSRAKKQPGGEEHAGEKGRGAGKRKKLRFAVLNGEHQMSVPLARVSRMRERSGFTTQASRAVGAVQGALGVGGCCQEILVLVTCSLQFAKAGSAATLSQQKKNSSADVQLGRVKITGFM